MTTTIFQFEGTIIFREVLSFLTLQEFYNLKKTCKSLSSKFDGEEGAYVKQFFNQLIRNQDPFVIMLYQNPSYISSIQSVNEIYHANSTFSKELREFYFSRYQLGQFLRRYTSEADTEQAIQIISDGLLKPVLMPLRLRRDSQTCDTYSLFQIHLNNVFYFLDSESQPIGTDLNQFKVEDEAAEFDSEMFYVANHDNMLIFQANWLMEMDSDPASVPAFIKYYLKLTNVFTSFCRLISSHLSNIIDPFILISEYGCKWNNYMMSMEPIGGYLRQFSKRMDELYRERFPDDCYDPTFSIWRMMTKIWYSEVFAKLDSKLLSSFKAVFEAYLDRFNPRLATTTGDGVFAALDEEEVVTSLRCLWTSVIDLTVNEVSIFQLTFSSKIAETMPAAQYFAAVRDLLKTRWQAIATDLNVKAQQKFEAVQFEGKLIENVIAPVLFPEISQMFAHVQEIILIDSFLQVLANVSKNQIEGFIMGKGNNCKDEEEIFRWFETDEAALSYPYLRKQIEVCKYNRQKAGDLIEERVARKLRFKGPEVKQEQKLFYFHHIN